MREEMSREMAKKENVPMPEFLKALQERLGPDVQSEVHKVGEWTHFTFSTDAIDYTGEVENALGAKAVELLRQAREAAKEKMPGVEFGAMYGLKDWGTMTGFKVMISLKDAPKGPQELPDMKKEIDN